MEFEIEKSAAIIISKEGKFAWWGRKNETIYRIEVPIRKAPKDLKMDKTKITNILES